MKRLPTLSSVAVGLAALAVGAFGTTLGTGCKTSTTGAKGDGGISVNDNCSANVASTSGTAAILTSGTTYQSKICFEGTSVWYTINVPSGSTLLDVAAGYTATSTPVDLDVKVYSLTNSTTLTQVDELIAPSPSDAGVDSIDTTLQVLQPGAYYLQVSDHSNMAFDPMNSYSITVATAVDPDSHEPNDTTAQAKPSDSKPGYLAYMGDLDIFTTTAATATDLLTVAVTNPAMAPQPITYTVTSSMGTTLAEGTASPSTMATSTVVPVTAAGKYYLTLNYPPNVLPDRTVGYTVSFGTTSNPNMANNHTIATATCPGGGSGPCSMAFSGQTVNLPQQTGYISVPGQHDYYRVDVTSGAALVLGMKVASSSSTPVKYAIDLLAAAQDSPCMSDSDCAAINLPCKMDSDCEMSHSCLPSGSYNFCPSNGVSCQLCEGAGLCLPTGGGPAGQCAVAQYISSYTGMGTFVGANNVSTAQPLFTNGTYYVNVHDAQYTNIDLKNPYTLTLTMAPEPDKYDQSTTPAMRNNFYNPYPTAMSDLTPDISRAVDITAQVEAVADGGAPQTITGYISYQTDEDWFSFQHPCPGMNCGINFEWVQPGPSPVDVAFFMLNEDLSQHENFAYTGSIPTTAPVTSNFANANCSSCSFAASIATNSNGSPYIYYLRIADLKQQAWDYSPTGQYSFKVTSITMGCPTACSEEPSGTCECYCSSTMNCPSPTM